MSEITMKDFADLWISHVRGTLSHALMCYCKNNGVAPSDWHLGLLQPDYELTAREIGEFCWSIDVVPRLYMQAAPQHEDG